MVLQNGRKRAERRSWPIHGYVGANGSGKSAGMVWDSLPSLDAGRPVLSTVRLLDYRNPRACEGWRIGDDGDLVDCELCAASPVDEFPDVVDETPAETAARRLIAVGHYHAHPGWRPFTQWTQLLDAERCDVLMDEVTGVASSRESHSMPAPVANALVQMRRRDVVIRWSAPSWARADKIIRECSQAVTFARGYMGVKSGDKDRMWRNRRLFKWCTYDAADFEEFTVGKREQMPAQIVDWHWGPGSPAFRAYDTYDSVLSIGTVSTSGRCYRCDGTRRADECKCADYQGHKAAHAAELAAVKPPRAARTRASA